MYTHIHIYMLISHLFSHSPVDACLGCFHVLGIVDSAAMNVEVHVSF